MQKNWIGKSTGCEIKFKLEDENQYLNILQTRPDTIFGASFLALSVDHPISKSFVNNKDFIKFKEVCLSWNNRRGYG